jgi:hypothetical protein
VSRDIPFITTFVVKRTRAMQNLIRIVVPEGRILFRATAYGFLAIGAFAFPTTAGWWAGLFFSYIVAQLLIGKVVANASDLVYRWITGQHIDRRFARWRKVMALHGHVPDDAYYLYLSGMTPRQAAEFAAQRHEDSAP